MSTTVKAGWLKDSQGNKFAPKTMSSQVITNDGVVLEDKITEDLANLETSVKEYTDTEIANLVGAAPELLDTFEEVATAIQENQDVADALQSAIGNKADKEHEHTVSDITDYVVPVQSDWNQNDETALDFVKNRPFYTAGMKEVVLLEETTLEPDEDGNVQTILPLIPLEENQTYTVIADGESHECAVTYIPEPNVYLIQTDLFTVASAPSQDETMIAFEGDSTHTISISAVVAEVTKLDEKYLPDSVFTKPDWDINDPSDYGFIKNRPFGRYLDYGYVLEDFTFEGVEYEGEYTSTVLHRFVEGQSYDVYFDGTLYEGLVYDDGLYYEDDNVYFEIYGDYWTDGDYVSDHFAILTNVESSHSISIEGSVYYYVQLDEAYLPASITADWNETNVNKRSYIKNKPISAVKFDDVLFDGEVTADDQYDVGSDVNYVPFTLSLPLTYDASYLLNDQVVYDVVLNGVEYKNLVCTFFGYNGSVNSFACGIGAYYNYNSGIIDFTEELPFHISLSGADLGLYLPMEFDGATSTVKVTVRGVVANKLPHIYQHQADWNELADTKASFIENKPFGEYFDYELIPIMERVELEKSIPGEDYEQFIYYDRDFYYDSILLNKRYTVILNGVRYDNLESFEYYYGENVQSGVGIGTPGYKLFNPAEEYPFFIEDGGWDGIRLYVNTEKMPIPEGATFYLYEYSAETKVKTLDVKYLSEQFQFGNVTEKEYIHVNEIHFESSSEYNGDSIAYSHDNGDDFKEGVLYRITFNGKTYENKCFNNSGFLELLYIGKELYVGYDPREQLIILSYNPELYPVGTTIDLLIERVDEVEVFKTIDKKYLPEYLQLGKIQNKTYADMQFDINFEVHSYDDGNVGYSYSRINTFEEGSMYKITLNGKEYELVAFAGTYYDEEGFIVVTDNKTFYIYGDTKSYGTHFDFNPDVYPAGTQVHAVIQKINIEETYKTLKTKYLPEHLRFGNVEADADIISEQQLVAYNAFTFYPYQNYSFATIAPSDFVGTLNGFDVNNTNKFYKVVFDGIEYYCKAFVDTDYNNELTIGSTNAEAKAGTGEYPFSIYFMQTNNVQITASGSENIHTFALSECEGTITQQNEFKTIETKYLPEHLQFGETEFVGTITNETTLYEGRTYTFYNYNDGTYGGTVDGCYNSPNLNNPEYFYRVIWDGAEYICAPFEGQMYGSTRMCIGSPYEEVLAGTSTYPFVMSSSHAGVMSVITNETKDSHAIDIYQLEGELIQPSGAIKPIETKYLPEHLRFGVTAEAVVEIESEEEYLAQTTYSFQSEAGYYVSTIENVNTGYFAANRFYRITWDGVEYYCWAIDDTDLNGNGCFHVGSPLADVVGGGYVTYPFTMHTDGVNITIYTNETDSYHTIKMDVCEGYYQPERVAKIDPKYLPEMNFDMSEAVNEAKAYTDEVAAGKANKEHTHSWNDLTDKPTVDDALTLLMETGYIEPVADEEGIITDDNNVIYTL